MNQWKQNIWCTRRAWGSSSRVTSVAPSNTRVTCGSIAATPTARSAPTPSTTPSKIPKNYAGTSLHALRNVVVCPQFYILFENIYRGQFVPELHEVLAGGGGGNLRKSNRYTIAVWLRGQWNNNQLLSLFIASFTRGFLDTMAGPLIQASYLHLSSVFLSFHMLTLWNPLFRLRRAIVWVTSPERNRRLNAKCQRAIRHRRTATRPNSSRPVTITHQRHPRLGASRGRRWRYWPPSLSSTIFRAGASFHLSTALHIFIHLSVIYIYIYKYYEDDGSVSTN